MRAADDFAAIRARMEQLQRERRQPEPGRDRREDDRIDPKCLEEVKRIIRAGSGLRC